MTHSPIGLGLVGVALLVIPAVVVVLARVVRGHRRAATARAFKQRQEARGGSPFMSSPHR